jgi:hypothetical protein
MGDDNYRPQTSWTGRNECSGLAVIPTITKHYRVFDANTDRTTYCAQETDSMCASPLVQKQVTTKGYAWQYGNRLKRLERNECTPLRNFGNASMRVAYGMLAYKIVRELGFH